METHKFVIGVDDNSISDFRDNDLIQTLITNLAENIIKSNFTPDLLIPIQDVDAPGGVIVGSQVASLLNKISSKTAPPFIMTADIETDPDMKRVVQSFVGRLGFNPTEILILDDVIFSGTTISSVISEIQTLYPKSNIRVLALVAHQNSPFIDFSREQKIVTYFGTQTNSREVMFPWGNTQWYGKIDHLFDIQNEQRAVKVCRRPWGIYEEFAKNTDCTVRIHTLNPKARMSHQRHLKRDEFFVALDPGITLTVNDLKVETKVGDYTLIPRNYWHRIINSSDTKARVLEIAFGEYDQTGDILRKEDDYERVSLDGNS
jgi:mannose-6-phosphate isomerase-like protein (cupin superfamily)/pyrimidine operon attenuation protein/uracil phosphoribosyltransferase